MKAIYGDSKFFSDDSSAYSAFVAGYWSVQQREVRPRCVFRPSKALDVSNIVFLSRLTNCPFAVKGGGHTAFGGASNIDGGITVNVESFKQVLVSADKRTVDVGPGNR